MTTTPDTLSIEQTEEAHPHAPFLAHHFESHEHQFDSCKLGMWLFLITEVLFFGGLFCVYTVYRVNHPEIFRVGHEFLDKQMGAINTIVLLFSSLTMAWGVRAAQLGQRKLLVVMLSLTLACAGGFLVIKYFEYAAKIRHGVLWASRFDSNAAAHYLAEHHATNHVASDDHHDSRTPPEIHDQPHDPDLPRNLGVFFSIYFALTGLHGIHILAGMAAIAWILRRAIRGDFGPQYFGPVDFVGLYWHLVDLIWIYLFPLLYLIH
jgi:cytochrome c oxidase subunit III